MAANITFRLKKRNYIATGRLGHRLSIKGQFVAVKDHDIWRSEMKDEHSFKIVSLRNYEALLREFRGHDTLQGLRSIKGIPRSVETSFV